MNRKSTYWFLFCFVFFSYFISVSQNENNKWYFGTHAGLDFMQSPPAVLTGSMVTMEGCASIADAYGNLLFYTDGVTVYNQTHSVMANGTGLSGSYSSSQSGVIVKQPGNPNIYFVFTLGSTGTGSLCYSTVDMNLASGNGSVTIKNVWLSSTMTEKLTSVRHCNGVDVWVLARTTNSPDFKAYLVTAAGVNTTAVVSSLGTFGTSTAIGYMKLSPSGKKLLCANFTTTAYSELFDFDPSTGAVSNSLSLGSGSRAYGAEFSPDGTKVYISYIGKITQFDLCAGSSAAIIASAYTIAASANYGMQLATDGKIYVARYLQNYIGVINSPNSSGSNCNYVDQSLSVLPNQCQSGFPNFITSGFKQPPPPFTFTVSNVYGCQGAAFTPPTVITSCGASGYSLTGLQWDFGDPGSGSANTSTSINPIHVFTTLGTYTVKLMLNYSCGGGTDTIKLPVNVNQLCIFVNSTSITCASLGSATVIPPGGGGPYSYTWMPSNQSGSVATNLSPGTYTLTIHDFGNNYTYTSFVILTSLSPLTGSVNGSFSITCYGATTGTGNVTNLAGGSGNQNYLWTNGIVSYTTPTVNTLSAGLWSVTVTDALTGCQINDIFIILQPPAMNLSLSANTPTACAGSSIVLTGANSGGTPGYTYTWANGPSGNSFTVSEVIAGTYVYTLNSTDTNNCSTSNVISAYFISNPILSVSNVSICPLGIGTLNVSGASSYTWNGSFVSTTFTANPQSTQQYTVVGSALSCTSLATSSIILKTIPNPILVSNSPRCNGDNLVLNGGGGISFLWSGPLSFTSAVQNPIINPVSVNNTGIYNVTVTAANDCTASTSQTIVVNPSPTISAAGSTVCSSGTLTLSANSMGSTFFWSGPQSFTSNLQSPFVVYPATNMSGTYTVKASSVLGCTNSAIALVNVVLPPYLTISLNSNGTLCAQALNGSPNTITLTSSGATTYTLTAPNYLYNPNPNGPVSPLITQPPYQNSLTVANATLEGSNGICLSTTTVSFSIIPNPTLTICSPTPVICSGKSYTYTWQGATSYSWSLGAPGLSTYSGPVAIASPTATSVYSVVGGSLGCNSGMQTSTITVHPLPTISIIPNTPTVCLNSKVNLIAAGALNYTWMPYNGLNTQNSATVSSGPLSKQSYTVTGASADNCTNTAMVTVSVLSLPSPIASISRSVICMNEKITLLGSGGVEYKWNGPSNFYQEGQNINFVANNTYYGGTYTLTVSDKNGCKASDTISLKVHPLPEGYLAGNMTQHCVPFCTDFSYVNVAGSSSLITTNWTINNKLFSQKSFSYCFVEAGDYIIKGQFRDTSTHCVNTKTFVVNAYPVPVADFKIVPEKPVEGLDEISFINASQGAKQNKWNWFFIDNHGYQSKKENTSYLFEEAGIYPVAMIVTNSWGCSDSIVKAIQVESDLAVYVPSAFSPNGDKLNDIFLPILRGIKLYYFTIYDRWGEKVFGTNDQLTGWDGTYKGEECKNDVYTWSIKLSATNGEMKTMTGFAMLSR